MSKQKGSRIKMLVIILAAFVMLITGGAAAYLHGIGAVDAKNDETVTVTVPSGSGASAIIDILDENGLVRNKTFAKIHTNQRIYRRSIWIRSTRRLMK